MLFIINEFIYFNIDIDCTLNYLLPVNVALNQILTCITAKYHRTCVPVFSTFLSALTSHAHQLAWLAGSILKIHVMKELGYYMQNLLHVKALEEN